jgi:hypothetical protein
MPDPKPDDVDFHEETDSSTYADDRNSTRWRSGRGTERKWTACYTPATASAALAQYSSVPSSTGRGSD